MKLQFVKNESGEICVKMEKDTEMIDFNYVTFIKQLLFSNEIEPEFEGLDSQEEYKLKELLNKIQHAVEEGMATPIE